MRLNNYIVHCYYKDGDAIGVQTIPIKEKSKDSIIKKIESNMEISERFTLWNFDFDTKDLIEISMPQILTVNEFFGDDGL